MSKIDAFNKIKEIMLTLRGGTYVDNLEQIYWEIDQVLMEVEDD